MATAVTQPATGIASIDGLLVGTKWSGSITFSFPQLATDYPSPYADLSGHDLTTAFSPVSAQQQAAVYAILLGQATAGVTNVMRATSLTSFIAPLIGFSGNDGSGDIRIGQSNNTTFVPTSE